MSVRDNPSKAKFDPKVQVDDPTRNTLEPTIAEMGNIFGLDLDRAGDLKHKAKAHQDQLLTGPKSFKDLFGEGGNYLGIKAENLRKKENYT